MSVSKSTTFGVRSGALMPYIQAFIYNGKKEKYIKQETKLPTGQERKGFTDYTTRVTTKKKFFRNLRMCHFNLVTGFQSWLTEVMGRVL